MRIGLCTDCLEDDPLPQALDFALGLGIRDVEIGSGGYQSQAHCDRKALLADAALRRTWKNEFESRGMSVIGLNCSGNPLHPKADRAAQHDTALRETIRLAGELGVSRVCATSGCPGTPDGGRWPHWSIGNFMRDFKGVFTWQWETKVVPYWTEMAALATANGVTSLCLELHPGNSVWNPRLLLKLRAAAGDTIQANLDPSLLFPLGLDPIAAIRTLGAALGYAHAKDTRIDDYLAATSGMLDERWPGAVNEDPTVGLGAAQPAEMPFTSCVVGYGHGADFWARFLYEMRVHGYDDVVSIEHDDPIIPSKPGVIKAVAFLGAICV